MADEIEDLPDGDTFDRAYVEKLRAESAKYRTSLRPFEDAFGDFNDQEKSFLFGMLKSLNADPNEGALQFRDMAKNILQDKFYADLDDIPVTEAKAEPVNEINETDDNKEDQVSLTTEQMQKLLDERDAKAAETAKAAAAKAAEDKGIEEVYAEIEAAGFARGTEAFQTALSLGASLAASGKDVDFAAIAPKVRNFHDMPEETPAPPGSPSADTPVLSPEGDTGEESGNVHPVTVGAGGSGGATEKATDWIAEAREAGRDVMDVARERMESRLDA